jgi:hypothetical protein
LTASQFSECVTNYLVLLQLSMRGNICGISVFKSWFTVGSHVHASGWPILSGKFFVFEILTSRPQIFSPLKIDNVCKKHPHNLSFRYAQRKYIVKYIMSLKTRHMYYAVAISIPRKQSNMNKIWHS